MKFAAAFLRAGAFVLLAANAPALADCPDWAGTKIVAQDGTYLGLIGGEYDSDSIFNEYGDHGSEYSDKSIFNGYSTYGSEYSDLSPFNAHAQKPPFLILNGQTVGLLTVNSYLQNPVNPYALIAACH